jgi:hypothetical protein
MIELMNQNFDMDDDLRPEYDFTQLTFIARGKDRKPSRKQLTDLDPWTKSLIGVIQPDSEMSLADYVDYLEDKYE